MLPIHKITRVGFGAFDIQQVKKFHCAQLVCPWCLLSPVAHGNIFGARFCELINMLMVACLTLGKKIWYLPPVATPFLAINWRLPFRSYGFKIHVSGNRKSGTEFELPSNNKNKPHKDLQTRRPQTWYYWLSFGRSCFGFFLPSQFTRPGNIWKYKFLVVVHVPSK